MFGFYFKLQNIVLLISSLFVALLQDPGQRSKPLPLFILLEEDFFFAIKIRIQSSLFQPWGYDPMWCCLEFQWGCPEMCSN